MLLDNAHDNRIKYHDADANFTDLVETAYDSDGATAMRREVTQKMLNDLSWSSANQHPILDQEMGWNLIGQDPRNQAKANPERPSECRVNLSGQDLVVDLESPTSVNIFLYRITGIIAKYRSSDDQQKFDIQEKLRKLLFPETILRGRLKAYDILAYAIGGDALEIAQLWERGDSSKLFNEKAVMRRHQFARKISDAVYYDPIDDKENPPIGLEVGIGIGISSEQRTILIPDDWLIDSNRVVPDRIDRFYKYFIEMAAFRYCKENSNLDINSPEFEMELKDIKYYLIDLFYDDEPYLG